MNHMRIRNWYSERARLLQEIALQQPITTDHISIRFKKLEGEQSVMVIHVDYEEVKKRKSKTLHIPMTDENLALSYLHEWLLYINLTWCCGSASVTVDNGEDKYTLSFEPVIHYDKLKFKNMANDIFETAYFYVYSSKKKRIVLSAYINSFLFFSHLDSMMMKHIKEHQIFELDENGNLASIRESVE
jgi:hypothetical protein